MLGRRSAGSTALGCLKVLARAGLVTRTCNNPTAPWKYTATGLAKALELGITAAAPAE